MQHYYFVTTHENGYRSYEGFRDEDTARLEAAKRAEHHQKTGQDVKVEYVGTELPEDLKYADTELCFKMQTLQGSEKQVAWARAIRYRFGKYLLQRFDEASGQERYKKEAEVSRDQASYWIDQRYSLADTNKASLFVAEGKFPEAYEL